MYIVLSLLMSWFIVNDQLMMYQCKMHFILIKCLLTVINVVIKIDRSVSPIYKLREMLFTIYIKDVIVINHYNTYHY